MRARTTNVDGSRWLRAGMPVVVLLLAALSAVPVRGACGAADTSWLLLHSRFRGMGWGPARAKTIAVLDDSVCGLSPEVVQMVGDGDVNHAVFSAGGGLYATTVSWSPPFCPTGEAFVTVNAPVALELPYTDSVPFYAFDHPLYRGDSLLVAVRDGAVGLRLHAVDPADGSVNHTETVSLGQTTAGQHIVAIAGDPGAADGDSALVILGAGGLVRRVAYEGTGWGPPQSRDIDAAETATAFGDGFLGTASGRIYRWEEGVFVETAKPASAAIRAVSAAGAVGDDGLVVVRAGEQWSPYTVGTARHRHFNFTKDRRGSVVELLDDTWRYDSYAYSDTPTRIDVTDPAIPVNSSVPYFVEGDADTVFVTLADPDSNFAVPSVHVREKGATAEEAISLTVDARGDTLRSRRPGAPCELGAVHLESPELAIEVDSSQVRLYAEAVAGTYDFTCATCYWARREFSAEAAWSVGDTLLVAVGPDTVRIYNGPGSVGSIRERVADSHRYPAVHVTAGGGLLVRVGPNVRAVRIYNAAGRLLASLPRYAGKPTVELPGRIAHTGVLYLRYLLHDGRTITCPVPMVR